MLRPRAALWVSKAIVVEAPAQFLLRPVEPDGLDYWNGIWKHDGGPDHVISGMISVPEFYASAGRARPDLSLNGSWVTAIYERLLDREPEAETMTQQGDQRPV